MSATSFNKENTCQTVAFHTLGCKLNYAETSTIARQLVHFGFKKVAFNQNADVYVINTCSVTEHADNKTKKVVAEAKKNNPNAKIAIIGCYAQLKPDAISKIPGVDIVLGAHEKFNVAKYLPELATQNTPIIQNNPIKDINVFKPAFSFGDRTRTFLKVQDGCDYFCAFCTIPLARGRSRNTTIEETVNSAKKIAKTSVKEIVLSGINLGDFGKSTKENFADLLRELVKIKGIERWRISSIEPNLLTDEVVDIVVANPNIVPHFHIPLQSGNDEILHRMRRRYRTDLYRSRIERIRQLLPDSCIGVDVICGFPGETDSRFLDTYQFLNELDVNYLHVFTYSERPNTTALRLPDTVPVKIRKQRMKQLRILSEKKRLQFYRRFLGKTRQVLVENNESNNTLRGFTDNYIKVQLPFNAGLINTVVPVKLTAIDRYGIAEAQPYKSLPLSEKKTHKQLQ